MQKLRPSDANLPVFSDDGGSCWPDCTEAAGKCCVQGHPVRVCDGTGWPWTSHLADFCCCCCCFEEDQPAGERFVTQKSAERRKNQKKAPTTAERERAENKNDNRNSPPQKKKKTHKNKINQEASESSVETTTFIFPLQLCTIRLYTSKAVMLSSQRSVCVCSCVCVCVCVCSCVCVWDRVCPKWSCSWRGSGRGRLPSRRPSLRWPASRGSSRSFYHNWPKHQ